MKKLINFLLGFILVILLLVLFILGAAFVFVEGRFVLSLEWFIYPNPANAVLRHSLRLLLALGVILYVIFELINLARKRKGTSISLFGINIGLTIAGIMMYILFTNYVDLVGLFLPSAILLIKFILTFITKYYSKVKIKN